MAHRGLKIGAFIVIILVIGVFYFYFFKPASKYKTNMSGLYSDFTPYMEKHVNRSLEAVDCSPDKYYYNDSSICFYCGNFDACFSYGWVNRSGGKKMNPGAEIELVRNYSKEMKLSFHSLGRTKLLDCVCNGKCICQDGITAEFRTFGNTSGVVLIFPKKLVRRKEALNILDSIGLKNCSFKVPGSNLIECKDMEILFHAKNKLVL